MAQNQLVMEPKVKERLVDNLDPNGRVMPELKI